MLAALSAGCMGYRIGNSPPAGIRTVHVPTFKNQTDQPLLEADTTRATIQALQQDGSLKVADSDLADSRLDVALTTMTMNPVVYDRNNARSPEQYRLQIQAKLSLIDARTGKAILERAVKGETLFKPGEDLGAAKRIAVPEASKDLAHQVVQAVLEYW
jgi:hypothetical protein